MTDFDRADLMTRTEVAEAAGLSIDTIAGLTAKMPPPVAKVVNESGHGGRQSLWRRSEIEAWVASRGGRGPKPGWYPHKPSGSTVKQSSPREIAERMVTEMLSVDPGPGWDIRRDGLVVAVDDHEVGRGSTSPSEYSGSALGSSREGGGPSRCGFWRSSAPGRRYLYRPRGKEGLAPLSRLLHLSDAVGARVELPTDSHQSGPGIPRRGDGLSTSI